MMESGVERSETQRQNADIKSHKEKLAKINALLDKLDERLAQGEITEARYRELREQYRAEAEKLKDHLTEQELMQEVGLEPSDGIEHQEEAPEKTKYYQQKKSSALAAFLSFMIPGVGQIYCGRGKRGIGIIILNIFLFFLLGSAASEDPNSDGPGILFLLMIIVWIWNIFDARKIARNADP